MWKWLVDNGLYKDLLAVVVMAIAAKVMRIGKTLKEVSDRLDTTTPGGLAELVRTVEAEEKKRKEAAEEEPDGDDDKTHPVHHHPIIHRHR